MSVERERWPLVVRGVPVGSVASGVLEAVADMPRLSTHLCMTFALGASGAEWRLRPIVGTPLDDALEVLARALCEAGLGGRWRGERLAVCGPDGRRIAGIERAVVRTLGIATWAVHLMGYAPDGRLWLQQRAFDKADDPGLWDTLVGGMVPDGETAESALVRETQEEAGLDLSALEGLRPGGVVRSRRPTDHAQGRGLLVERLDWFRAVLPDGMQPENRDGEVARFACVSVAEARQWLAQGRITQDAAAILGQALGGWVPPASP